MSDKSDKELIVFIYRKYYPLIRKRMYEIIKDNSVMDDNIHDLMVSLLKNIHIIRDLDEPHLISYVNATTKNIALNYIKRREISQNIEICTIDHSNENDFEDTKKTPEELCLLSERIDELKEALNELEFEDRDLLIKRFVFEMSDKEIAEYVNIPIKHIRTRVSRVKKRLLKIIALRGKDNEEQNEEHNEEQNEEQN